MKPKAKKPQWSVVSSTSVCHGDDLFVLVIVDRGGAKWYHSSGRRATWWERWRCDLAQEDHSNSERHRLNKKHVLEKVAKEVRIAERRLTASGRDS